MTRYSVRDESGTDVEIEAESADLAAQKYVDDGDWGGSEGETWWAKVWTVELDAEGEEIDDSRESHTIEVNPSEPDCTERSHDWQSPFELVGGLRENPGVRGHGGGVIVEEVCMHCGCARVTDTWAQCPTTGEQGLTSIEYREGAYAIPAQEESAA